MSTITYLTSLVQQAIQRLNNYEANAKKVDELPHQTTLEPSSKIPVSRAGNSEHLTVQQIISSIQNSNYNQLLAIGTISVSGTDITVPSGVSGQINGLLYGTSTDTILSITLCPTGFSRKDIIVLTTANTVVVISGEETDGAIVLAPPVPTDSVYITEFDVNDTTIGAPIDPTLGTQFKNKSESAAHNDPTLSGTDAVVSLQPNGQSVYAFSNAGLTSIDGFGLDLITGNPSAETPYAGKDILIYNNKAGNLTLKHDGSGTADVKFLLEGGADLVIPAGGKVWLKYGSSYCEMIFKSWIDLSTKADLVGGKVPAEQLPAYVDDVLEFANLASFPVTGETGKIYLALDTNITYRWTGSAYVQIGGGSETLLQVKGFATDFPISNLLGTSAPMSNINIASGTADYNRSLISTTETGHQGLVALRSSTNANSGFCFFYGGAIINNGDKHVSFFQFKLPTVTDIKGYVAFHSSTTTAEPVNACFLEIVDNTGVFKTRRALTTASSSFTLSANTWYNLMVEFKSTTEVHFKIKLDDGTLVAEFTSTTNLPLFSATPFSIAVNIFSTVATTARDLMLLDYVEYRPEKPNHLKSF